jgi:hypothetical protein
MTIEQLGRFLGLLVDGIVVQRGMGFDPPDADAVVRLAEDAIASRRSRERRSQSAASSSA